MEKTIVKNTRTSKIASMLLYSLVLIMLAACSPTANTIKGHTYYGGSSDSGMKVYFSPSGSAQITHYLDGTTTIYSNFTYTIDGNIVEIYYDYSDYWKLEAQGKLFLHFTYDPETDTLRFDEGDVLSRMN